tara:strand:+ start:3860 stop:5113 length:1254 start_codon:yes stop_codon:yes gene_type:complete
MKQSRNALSWEELQKLTSINSNYIEGPNNSYSSLRLFGKPKSSIRVTLFRDKHAWCPYCQKVWLWLELKKIPYAIKKVTMRCYGRKESWYLEKVPSGMLPAIELDGKIITESDDILLNLEGVYGPLGKSLQNNQVLRLRKLERELFRSWCIWLCNPSLNESQEGRRKKQFQNIAEELQEQMLKSSEPWLDPEWNNSTTSYPGSGDVIFIPYLERMNASLAYYKGLCLREDYPAINEWFKSLEKLEEYRGTQGDFHTHAHDLPPQMGGCWLDPNPKQKELSMLIDIGEGLQEYETSFVNSSAETASTIALTRVVKHRESIIKANPLSGEIFDQPLRAALTQMMLNQSCQPIQGSALGLRYLRDRISVPRDMPVLAARELRQALEKTAKLDGPKEGPPISTTNRFDQNPEHFQKSNAYD